MLFHHQALQSSIDDFDRSVMGTNQVCTQSVSWIKLDGFSVRTQTRVTAEYSYSRSWTRFVCYTENQYWWGGV